MMRKPYSSPNFDDPVEYLTPPFRGQGVPPANARTPVSAIASFTMTITVDFEHATRCFDNDHSEDRHE